MNRRLFLLASLAIGGCATAPAVPTVQAARGPLAELQLKVIWEEILKRFPSIQLVGEPVRVASSFIKGYESLPVLIPARN